MCINFTKREKISPKVIYWHYSFLYHFIAIDIFWIFFYEKRVWKPIFGFFQHFLALFETFTTLQVYWSMHEIWSILLIWIYRNPVWKNIFWKCIKGSLPTSVQCKFALHKGQEISEVIFLGFNSHKKQTIFFSFIMWYAVSKMGQMRQKLWKKDRWLDRWSQKNVHEIFCTLPAEPIKQNRWIKTILYKALHFLRCFCVQTTKSNHHQLIRAVSLFPMLYLPSTLNIDLLLWHTQLIVCAENVKSWFKSLVFPFTFQAYFLPHTLNCICVCAYLNFIFEF